MWRQYKLKSLLIFSKLKNIIRVNLVQIAILKNDHQPTNQHVSVTVAEKKVESKQHNALQSYKGSTHD
jgi:hypothetical protein